MKALLSILAAIALAIPLAAEQPNMIVIMADDVGYGDLSCYGADDFETPYLDQLAEEGIRFTSGYCSASTCTPTRYSLLTGTYAFRQEGTGIAPPSSPLVIPEDTTTIADVLSSAGYKTAVIGKWHLGLGGPEGPDWNGDLKPGPIELGFDTCFLLPTTNDRVPQVYVKDHRILNLDPADPIWVGKQPPSPEHPTGVTHRDSLKMDWTHGHNHTIHNGISRIGYYTGGHAARFRDEDLADKWVEQSVKWMEDNQGDPFFLFFASHDNHVPRMPHERFQGATPLGFRADSIVQLDWCVGELMKAADRLGIAENTIFVFCSDNGPVMDDGYADGALEMLGDHRAAGPFKGGKYSVYEGGTRTPFITRWKGTIEPAVSDEVVSTIDLFASLANLAGTELPDEAALDSIDVMGALIGEEGAKGRAELVQQDNGRVGNYGFRQGDWKLVVHEKGQARNVVVETKLANTEVPNYQLFNLADDPEETKDVIAENPQIAETMKTRLSEIIDSGRSR
ncbi:MAG: arylsulfatase [Verrucomicrobiota bacterium]